MPQERLSNDDFFTKLTELLAAATNAHKHSVFLIQKPLNPLPSADAPPADTPSALLIRATNGKAADRKIKVATIVEAKDLESFFARYADVCKGNMGALKKRDRKKKKDRLKAKKGKGEALSTNT